MVIGNNKYKEIVMDVDGRCGRRKIYIGGEGTNELQGRYLMILHLDVEVPRNEDRVGGQRCVPWTPALPREKGG